MPNMPMLQVVTRVPLQLIELKFWKFSKLDAWPYNCPFLLCLFLSFFFYFLLFSSDLNTTSHKKVIFLSASSFGCSTCLLLQPSPVVSSELRFVISSPSPVCFFFFFIFVVRFFQLHLSLSFPLAEVFHFLFATRGFLRAFFLLHFCGLSLPSSLLFFCFGFLLSFCCYACFLLNW